MPDSPPASSHKPKYKPIDNTRMAVLFLVMLVTASGNTAMQSILPTIGTQLKIPDFWVSAAFSWSALSRAQGIDAAGYDRLYHLDGTRRSGAFFGIAGVV